MLDVPPAWRAILAVDEEGQFSRAAARLGMNQPQLSRLIARTERRLGIPIFERRPHAAATGPGRVIVDAIRSAIGEIQEATAKARQIANGSRGQVTLGFASSAMATAVPAWLKQFSTAFPDVSLTLTEMHSSQQAAAIRAGEIDLAIGREDSKSPDIASLLLLQDILGVGLSSSHRLASRQRIVLSDLKDERFILFDRSCAPSLHDHVIRTCEDAGFTPRVAHSAREWHSVLALVAAGYGVTLVPSGLSTLSWPELAHRPLADATPALPTYLLIAREAASPAAWALADLVRGRALTRAVSMVSLPQSARV
jgi:DNA-binding transcriptional LysR family regulator